MSSYPQKRPEENYLRFVPFSSILGWRRIIYGKIQEKFSKTNPPLFSSIASGDENLKCSSISSMLYYRKHRVEEYFIHLKKI